MHLRYTGLYQVRVAVGVREVHHSHSVSLYSGGEILKILGT